MKISDGIDLSRSNPSFTREINKLSRVTSTRCFQCRSCSNGCPFVAAMDYPPNVVMRLVQLGCEEAVLSSSSIWICVGCNTCCSNCPNAIDIPAVMDALRQTALKKGYSVAEPEILNFHEEVLSSIRRYGRTHKLDIMLRYKLRTRDLFTDMDKGLKMFAKRKLDLAPSRVKAIGRIRKIFEDNGEVRP